MYVEGVLQDAIFCPAFCGPHSSSRTHINSVEDAVFGGSVVGFLKDSKTGFEEGCNDKAISVGGSRCFLLLF